MDRIDKNVFDARYNAHCAKDQLKEVHEWESSVRASGCIICLVQGILICVVMIAL